FGLIGVGAGAALLRRGAISAVSLLRRRLFVTLEIPSRDPAYAWFLQWASVHGLGGVRPAAVAAADADVATAAGRQSLLSRLLGAPSNQLSVETAVQRRENGSVSTSFSFVPGPGRHLLRYGGTFIQVERARERAMVDLRSGAPWETVTLTALARDRALLQRMLGEARDAALAAELGKTVVYTSYGPEWRPFGSPRRRRALNSVVLAAGVAERIVTDVCAFLENGKWYHDRGIPYRRGYLLHGPPGSGKTSFIQALAGHLDYNICVMNLSERGMTDDRLAHLLANAPARSFILLEDIDAAFSEKRQTSDKQGFHSLVTFSGLLNALDGVAASEERLVFMTTNHAERLDAALVRPGRVDVRALVDTAHREQAARMFERFYDDSAATAAEFAAAAVPDDSAAPELRPSPAALQGLFVVHRDRPADAIVAASRLAAELAAGDRPGGREDIAA
ncbi:hypothetical protein HK405_012383, partial [Cladochytrium tenue]